MKEYTENYLRAGGKSSFSEYYLAAYEGARFDPALVDNVVFARHNLVQDGSFNEFQVVLCRNVMIYFDRSLQQRVLDLLADSLATFGVLALGHKESIRFTEQEPGFEVLDADQKLYRKVK
jgi:chemotaxis protein methyltransferase CheR